jgi:ABC-type sugar transport system permease subunit
MYKTNLSLRSLLPRLIILGIVDVFAIRLFDIAFNNISPVLGIGIAIFTVIANIVYLDDRLFPWRWIFPALTGMFLLVIYPMGYALATAFTNLGEGHALSKEQAIAQFTDQSYSAPDAPTLSVYFFGKTSMVPTERTLADFRFLIVDADGKEYFVANGDTELTPIASDDPSITARNDKGIPSAIGDYTLVTPAGLEQRLKLKTDLHLPEDIQLTKLQLLQQNYLGQAQQPKYVYDPVTNKLTDKELNIVYVEQKGTFVPESGEGRALVPGFAAYIGFDNLLRVVTDDSVRDPFWRVFVWTVVFAIGSVGTTFAVGLLFAMILNNRDFPIKPLWRSLLIIPYAIPGWLTASVWRGLLNPAYGPINIGLKNIFGVSPDWFADPGLAKVMVLLVNLYLGFPYMMLICLGALQSIPADMYEAALIDGANERQKFQFITLPMLLVAVGPLLIASFAYNFNNFTLIQLLTTGGPPMSAATAAGHTDILLSYTYRLAFAGGRGSDYGFASAIGIFIFLIVGTITFLNFRFTNTLEKVSE